MASCKSLPTASQYPSVFYENLLPHSYKILPELQHICEGCPSTAEQLQIIYFFNYKWYFKEHEGVLFLMAPLTVSLRFFWEWIKPYQCT